MAFSPIQGSALIEKQYKRYLSTMFRIADPQYQKQFEAQLSDNSVFSAGPFLDAHDNFATGKTTRELVREGVLPPFFLKYGFYHDRPLYSHQETALRKALAGNNIVVSTGTGSGKTESFLMPILAALAQEAESNTLHPGVRALLIYPMNALANDQVERMRSLLAKTPEITFGCYTGQTRNKYEDALSEYRKLNRKNPADNELICREQMKQTPPHLLITNYAMLEYLMVRPGDKALFAGNAWRFVVLDEAHVYRGSTGIEVSMLLRRLKATLNSASLQYFLTSATLGDESENEEVAAFATNLCNSLFDVNNIIRAQRLTIPHPQNPLYVPSSLYRQIQKQIEEGLNAAAIGAEIMKDHPEWELSSDKPLFDLVHRDERYWRIRNLLKEPCTINKLVSETGISAEDIESFVAVASFCEADGIRLLDARYHTFLRATDSVFITLAPSNRLFLTRTSNFFEPSDGKNYKVFEINTCSSCHNIYLTGKLNEETHCLDQTAGYDGKSIFYLGSHPSVTDEDTEEKESRYTPGKICALCGHFKRDNVRGEVPCCHGASYEVPVVWVKTKAPEYRLKKCVCCEAVNNYGILRSFFTGQEAVTSVIATSLFNALPAQIAVQTPLITTNDDFGFGFEKTSVSSANYIQQARQFLCFSDSRQASAYFATYLDTTYRNLLYKRCITDLVEKQRHALPLNAFCEDLSSVFEKHHLLSGTGFRLEKESWKAILAESADSNSDNSLSGMGILSIGLLPESFPANPQLNLTGAEVTDMINILISSMISDLAVNIPCAMSEEDREFYSYGQIHARYQAIGSNSAYNIKSFVPKNSARSNKRLDYLLRMLAQKVPGRFEADTTRKLLLALWNLMEKKDIIRYQEDGYQLNHEKLYLNRPSHWYRCNKCHKLTPFNIGDTCVTYHCSGKLEPINPETELQNNHYYRLYHDMDLQPLRVREHTAQLDRDKAYEYQQDFKDKKIDVLSCSTTFEMGVDVGSLETVFMRNMPPMPSNYAQRAGRAGRSRHSAAFALTFCNRSSHDFSYFNHPVDMISGKIHAPHFNIINEKIAIRHLYASALAFFWRLYPDLFSTVEKMAETKTEETGYDLLTQYLNGHPSDLKAYLKAFLPAELYNRFGCEQFTWIDGLLKTDEGYEGLLTKAVKEYSYEVNVLEEARKEAFAKNRSTGYLEQRLRTYRKESILSFLSRRNVMPQYGFPVDTVPLSISGVKNGQQYGVELQRDLSMAISEYAPGSQVVANGEMFTGRYIKKIPQIGWKMYDYIYCDECSTLNIDPHVDEQQNPRLVSCKMCSAPLRKEAQKTFIVPSFGFEIDPDDIKKPGLIRPEKTYRTDVSYVGYRNSIQMHESYINKTSVLSMFAEKDEMAVLNRSDFHVCPYCGYAETGKGYFQFIQQEHHMPSGRKCANKSLHKYSLGYRFETDVFQFVFPDHPLNISDTQTAFSTLYALIRGVIHTLDLEDDDIAGCLQSINLGGAANVSFILYDTTPGGAGHVRRLQENNALYKAILNAWQLMKQCNCGGTEGHASCYACLRTYRNQKLHDILDRSLAIEYLNSILSSY